MARYYGKPTELAGPLVYLATSTYRPVTGETVKANGGPDDHRSAYSN
ncbi:hypothetical protein [Hymenobacter sp.]